MPHDRHLRRTCAPPRRAAARSSGRRRRIRIAAFGVALVAALALGGVFLVYAVQLYRDYSDELARATFKFSIYYLAALFSALLIDHYWR